MFKRKARKRREGEYDKSRFISEDAEQRYELSVKGKAIVPERGFHNPGGRTETILEQRDWHYFARQPSEACIPLVREFYANAYEHRDFTVFVRGKWVPFSASAINKVYRLHDIQFDQYTTFSSGEVEWDNVIQALCKPDSGATWRLHDGKPVNFHSGGLTSEAKAWHYFISGKLMPTMNTSEVTKDRALLNYCIFAGLTIDVGSIIHSSIMQYIKSTTIISTSGLGHPALINALCGIVGLHGEQNEETINPRSVLTKQKICSYTSRLAQFEGEGTSSTPRTPPTRQKSLSISEQMGRMKDELCELKLSNQDLGKRQMNMENDISSIKQAIIHNQDQQMSFFEYMGDYNASMSQNFANFSRHTGSSYVDFPEPPTYRFFSFEGEKGKKAATPETSEEEEEDDEDETE